MYWLRTDRIEERPDTLVFRLLARGERRLRAVREVEAQRLEPYLSTLRNFEMRFKIMESKNELAQLDPKDLEEMGEIVDAERRAMRELGRQEGLEEMGEIVDAERRAMRELGRQEGQRRTILKFVARRWPELAAAAELLVPEQTAEPALDALFDQLDPLRQAGDASRALKDWRSSLADN